MKKVELLSPVGDFECLKAAVQNGANAVYLGVSEFNARYSAKNFSTQELKNAINYSHLRNVKVFLTLNTLIKNEELDIALDIVNQAYSFGIDGIIVQDLGLANLLIKKFPNLPIHASTQMTCHNLSGAKKLENIGFKRIVLARELTLNEIEYISSNTSCEIEVFIHGALCISYSGQCLYSSLIGGRSGNRGKCAQGCRLPYTLLENNSTIDKGYLLSPKDLCSLELLPELVNSGITSLKIEGRMKAPEYVATVTKIYRKYLDKIYNNEKYIIDEYDKKDLLQVFNRGGFSSGHLLTKENKDLVYKEKSNNIGLYLGNVANYNSNKGHITLNLNETIKVGDTISFENEDSKYTVSELMQGNNNIAIGNVNSKVTLGRMKGNIKVGDKVYKLTSKDLLDNAKASYTVENIKQPLNAILTLKLNEPISLEIYGENTKIIITSESCPEKAINSPITKDRLINQLNKTTDTPYFFKNIEVNLDDNLFLPHISTINELRRKALEKYSEANLSKYTKGKLKIPKITFENINKEIKTHETCLLLNTLNLNYDYSKLENVDKLYVPIKYFAIKEYRTILKYLSIDFNLYIYLPNILKTNFTNLFKTTIDNSFKKYNIKGFVISNIGYFDLLKEYINDYEFIGNYTLNVFNNSSINSLKDLNTITISPELNLDEINSICSFSKTDTEFIVYGNLPLMTSSYCLLGKSNKCYPDCKQKCLSNNKYFLKDRMNFSFRIIPDNIQTLTTIYNSKITSISSSDIPLVDNYRIDILDETIEEINNIIKVVNNEQRLEGPNYTNGNLKRTI